MRPANGQIQLMVSTADERVDRVLVDHFRDNSLFAFAGRLPPPHRLARAEIPPAAAQATVAVVDLESMLTREKFAAIERLHARGYRVVLLGDSARPGRLGWLMHAGARAFISKRQPLSVLPESVYLAARDVRILSPGDERRPPSEEVVGFADVLESSVTPREREVLGHIHAGLTDAQIATRMGISRGTTFVYVKSLLKKFGATNRVQLAVRYEKYRAHAPDAPARAAS